MVNKLLHRISFLLLFVFTILVAQAGTAPMVLEYNTNLSEGTTIQIPLIGTDLIFDWGDGNKDTIPSCVDYVSHTYATHGIYTISFTGVVTSYGNWHNNQGIEKLTRVISFGDLGITSFNFAFMGAFNLIEVPANIPSSVTTTQQMFQDATSFNGDLSTWDVSNIHDMGFMFAGASFFNSNISNWNVSSVANMNGMFESTNFNQNIGNWNVSNVTSMDSMFENTISFNRDLSSWDVSKVNSMISMFSYDSLSAENYDKLLIGWSERSLQPNVIFDAGDSRYSLAGYDAREHLKNTFNWDITDGGLINPPLANYSYHINEFEASFTNESANAISYLWKFGDGTTSTDENPTHIYTNSGTYKVTLFAIYSTLQDSVSQIDDINCTTSFATDTHTACNSFTWIDGITYTESNSTAKYTLTNTGGCDSVVTLNLTINKSTTGTDVQSATDSFTWIDGITYTESNFTATHTLTNAAGCDSIVTLNLTLSPKPVILEFEVTNPNDKVIVLPIYGINLNIDWGDGIIEKRSVYSSVSHTYLNIGTYIVKINGNLESIGRDNFSFGDKLTKVLSFGNLGITSLRHAFINATRLAQVPDFLPSTVTEMYGMFKGATSFNGDISNWNVSNVTNMGFLFIDATSFNGDISNWNVSNVINMNYMFQDASSFNRDISNWGVSNVTNMSNMFYNATSFNGDISNWDVSNVTNMQRMFSGASSFNRDISNWDVNMVTNMYYMFYNASSFNGDISRWNVSLVTNMNAMFYNATSFNGNISKWNVIKVADMTNMFYGVKIPAENYTALLITWANLPVKTSVKFHAGSSKYAPEAVIARNKLTINKYWTITDGGQIAKPTAAFSFQKDGYEVSFTNNSSSNSTAYLWKFGDGTSSSDKNPTHIYTNPGTYKVILYAINVIVKDSLLQPIDIICTSTYASDTHSACNSYTWIDGITYTKNNNTAKYILTNVGGCDSVVTLNLTINKSTTGTDVKGAINSYTWIDGNTYTESNNTATHTLTSAAGCDSVVTLNLTIFKNPMVLEFDINSASTISLPLIGTNLTIYWGDGQIQKLTSVNGLVNHYYKSTGIYTVLLDGSLTTYGSNSFTYNPNAGKLTKVLSFGNLGITSLAYAFMSEMSLIKVPEHLPSTVINLLYTFHNARSFNGDINNWDVSNVTNMERAFGGATSFNGDISNWDVSKVTNMSNIFDCATSFNGDISNWDVSNVTDMFGMFGSATSFNGDISNWDVSKVTNMSQMFSGATSFNGDISKWNVSIVTFMNSMFKGAISFNGNISNWNVSKVTNMTDMFLGVDIPTENYTALLINWAKLLVKSNVTFNGGLSKYTSEAVAARNKLDNDYYWTITDGGELLIPTATYSFQQNGNEVSFTNESTNGTSYLWSFDDGTTSTEINPTHTYANPGTYIVTLYAINDILKDSLKQTFEIICVSNSGTDVQTACDSFTWMDGITYTENNNTAKYTLTNIAGCDSIVTLNLTLLKQPVIEVQPFPSINSCENDPDIKLYIDAADKDVTYQWYFNGEALLNETDSVLTLATEFSNEGTYFCQVSNTCNNKVSNNSVVTINHSTSSTDVITACDSYTWIDGNTYTESNNTATFALTSATGCDSIVTLDLTINNNISGIDVITACDSYTWIDGNTYTESNNTATFALTNATGCDSIVTLDLTINHSVDGTDIITACESYTWIDGITYTSNNNTATFTLTNALGCDSIVNLDLTLVEGPMILEFNTTLSNQTEKGFTENKSTKSSETTIGIPLSEGNIIIDWGDGNMDTILEIPVPSIFTHTFANEGIYKVKITGKLDTYGGSTINDYAGKLTKVISFGNLGISSFDYAFANENKLIEVPAVIPESVKSMKQMFYGASLFKGDLSTWDVSRIIDMQDMFDGATSFDGDISNWIVSNVKTMDFIFRGTSLSTYRYDAILNKWSELPLQENVNLNNSNYFTSSSASARQKIITLYHWSITDKGLILNPTAAFTYTKDQKTVSFTNNSAHAINYQWDFGDGTRSTDEFPIHTFENVGNYIVSLIATNYDLKDTLNILIEVSCDVENVIDRQFACDSYTWIDGNTYTESNNTATFALTNAAGCDSIVTLDLTINHSTYGTDVITACDSYTWIDGNTYTESNNTATFALTSAAGCDSIVTLDLTINHSISGTDVITACDSYTWIDGNTYTESNNTATFALTNAAGCDSIVTLDLTINHSTSGTDVITACDSYTWIDGNTYTESNNTATFALTNAAGCDSIVTLDLTINHSIDGTDVITACDSYTWIDGNTYTVSNNTATFALTNAAGCDSVITLDLTINHSISGTDVISACDSYTWIDGNTYTESNNTATFTLTSATGCDSIVTLDLTINNNISGIDVITACDSYTWIDGNTYTESNNTATFALTNAAGCDSIVTLDLTINHSVDGTDVITACDSYPWIDGNTYTESNNTATFALTNAAGCDSIVTLDLTINNSISGTDVITACDSFTWIDGNTYTESNNTATFALTSATGCDSIVTLDLTINHSISGTDVITACDSYTWIDGNTYTESNNTATFALTNATGCDSIVTLNLTINQSYNEIIEITICNGETYSFGNQVLKFPGEYSEVFISVLGCDSLVSLNLKVTNVDTEVIQDGVTLTANATDAIYQWGTCGNVFLPIKGETSKSYRVTENGNYAVIIEQNSCVDTSICYAVTWYSILDDGFNNKIEIYPNPTNDYLNIDFKEIFELIEVFVINPMGKIIITEKSKKSDSIKLDFSTQPQGIYDILIKADGLKATYQIVNK